MINYLDPVNVVAGDIGDALVTCTVTDGCVIPGGNGDDSSSHGHTETDTFGATVVVSTSVSHGHTAHAPDSSVVSKLSANDFDPSLKE